MAVLEATKPIGSDWLEYLRIQEIDREIASLKGVEAPIALKLLQDLRADLALTVQDRIAGISTRITQANNEIMRLIEDSPSIEDFEKMILVGTAEANELQAKLATMSAYDRFEAQWGLEQQLAQLRQRISGWRGAIANHPSKRKLTPMPDFVEV